MSNLDILQQMSEPPNSGHRAVKPKKKPYVKILVLVVSLTCIIAFAVPKVLAQFDGPPDFPGPGSGSISGIRCDLLWSDPEKGQSSWGENDRGVSYTFGETVIKSFLKKNDIDLICRAH